MRNTFYSIRGTCTHFCARPQILHSREEKTGGRGGSRGSLMYARRDTHVALPLRNGDDFEFRFPLRVKLEPAGRRLLIRNEKRPASS